MHYDESSKPEKFDEFLLADLNSLKDYDGELAKTLEENPSAQLYVIVSFKKKTSQISIIKKEQQVLKFLISENKINKDRITLIRTFSDKQEFAQLWLVASGVMPPVPEKINENR